MDLKQVVDAVLANWQWLLLLAVLVSLPFLLAAPAKRAWRALEDTVFDNWQLALLGSAALILSLAGGWTTWDGMTNFTGEKWLSLMFTFGIHGVMLIVAWLIGESFASGMSTVARSGLARATYPLIAIVVSGGALLAVATAVYQWRHGISADLWIQGLVVAGLVLGVVGLVLVFARSEIIQPYAQAMRIMAKNAMLWVMFLACMSTSVFFSFDSRFNVVFPQDERKRVADLRAQNQVTGILADIGATIETRRASETEALFASPGWNAYDAQLVKLARQAQGSQGEIEGYFVQKIEERRRAIAEQQERIATSQSGQAGLSGRKLSLTEELSQLKTDRPSLAAEYNQHKSDLAAKAREVDAKRVETMAEERGVEGSGKVGRGQFYRQRTDELERLRGEYKIKEERTKDAQKRLLGVETRIAHIERELSAIDGDLAKLKGETATAEQRIRAAEAPGAEEDGLKIDPARVLPVFERARTEFRQDARAEKLAVLQQQCAQLYNAMAATPATKEKVRSIDCDPKQASEAAATLFAVNTGSMLFEAGCVGGDKLAPHTNADQLFGFARKCLADSGLPSKDTDTLRTKISYTELTRDDRAHRFVVSLNAFQDGNRLAYLALAIAIGIDSLIFMTGLFGANAVRSPLSDVPSQKARTARQLEGIIENALLPDTLDNARFALKAMRPITNEAGFMAEVRPEMLDPHTADRVLTVLNAGTTIHAVAYDEMRDRYLVRSELFEFLSLVAKKAFEESRDHADLAELEKVVQVALLPDIGPNAETVLHYMHPISEEHGFTAEIRLDEVGGSDQRVVRSTLNAAATLQRVQRIGNDKSRFFIHRDLYRTLARIRAAALGGYRQPRVSGPAQARDGGALTPDRLALENGRSSEPRLGLPVGPPVPRLDAPAARPREPSEAEEDFRADRLSDLIMSLGVEPEAYTMMSSAAVSAAIAAGEAFSRLRQSNQHLDELLTERDEQVRTVLHDAFDRLARDIDDEDERRALKLAYDEIEENWSIIMLLPGGPFESMLKKLVEMLEPESGAGQLAGDQQDLLWISKRLYKALDANARSTERSWRRIEALLTDPDDSVPSSQSAMGGNKRIIN